MYSLDSKRPAGLTGPIFEAPQHPAACIRHPAFIAIFSTVSGLPKSTWLKTWPCRLAKLRNQADTQNFHQFTSQGSTEVTSYFCWARSTAGFNLPFVPPPAIPWSGLCNQSLAEPKNAFGETGSTHGRYRAMGSWSNS